MFSANKADSDMEDNYSWLSDSVRNCVCSEPQLWPWICFSTDYSFCQAHTSPSARHDTATHWHRNSAVFAGSDHRSVSGLFPVLIYTFGRWGNQTCTVFKMQGRCRRTRDTQIERSSKTPDGLLYSFVCVVSHLIHFSVLNIQHTFLWNWSLTPLFCFSSFVTVPAQPAALPHSSLLCPTPKGMGRRIRKKKLKLWVEIRTV